MRGALLLAGYGRGIWLIRFPKTPNESDAGDGHSDVSLGYRSEAMDLDEDFQKRLFASALTGLMSSRFGLLRAKRTVAHDSLPGRFDSGCLPPFGLPVADFSAIV
ncbi:hypothetical protein C6Q14_10270 [Burkholderia ambifaria]|nr:hypothetical protein C6Q14_10270 [Burkholderia ambifaria]